MNIKTTITETSEKTTTEAIVVGPNVEVQRITVERTSNGKTTTAVAEKVAFTGKTNDEHFGHFVVVPPDLPEKLRLTGFFCGDDGFKPIADKPFTHITSGKPYVIIRISSWDNTVHDVEGGALPVGMHFSDIDGHVANDEFYLTGLVDHLKSRGDVTLLPPRFAEEGKFIHDIPHYNCEKNHTRCLKFIWHPDVETWRRFKAELGDGDHWARYKLAHTYMGNDAFRVEKK